MSRISGLLVCCFILCSSCLAQVTTDDISRVRMAGSKSTLPVSIPQVADFYSIFGMQLIFSGPGSGERRAQAFALLRSAPYYAIDETITVDAIDQLEQVGDLSRVESDLAISISLLRFFNNLVFGDRSPSLSYKGWTFHPGFQHVNVIVATALQTQELPTLASSVNNKVKVIERLCYRLGLISQRREARESMPLSVRDTSGSSGNMMERLYRLGITDSINTTNRRYYKDMLVRGQRCFGLLADGLARTTLLAELNIPIAVRIRQLQTAINYYRWLYSFSLLEPLTEVNIPAAYLNVYGADSILLSMKMVVGKPSTPTPTLSSTIETVIVYPYWNIPQSIASNELLPAIRRNPGYAAAHAIDVVNSGGRTVLRQRPGCRNSLGLIKLDFYNPFHVYLHDTPLKGYFDLERRYFSHGCMRMECPVEMAGLLLGSRKAGLDSLMAKGCNNGLEPLVFKVDKKMPLIVWYNPAGLNAWGEPVFYPDIYGKFK